MHRKITAIAAGLVGLVVAATAASAASRVEVGVLSCHIGEGSGLVITSSKALSCTFDAAGGADESYVGTITKLGIDVGTTTGGKLVWAVFAPSRELPPGALAGRYAGIGAEATVGAGIGANALVGGFEKSVALQPVSVQAQQGLNIALGISAMELETAQ